MQILQEGTYLRRSCTCISARGRFCSFVAQQSQDKFKFVCEREDSQKTSAEHMGRDWCHADSLRRTAVCDGVAR